MSLTQPRHDDIIIRRRFGQHPLTHTVKQIYAVTYPGHTDQGAERENYGDAEEVALGLAQEQGRSVWYGGTSAVPAAHERDAFGCNVIVQVGVRPGTGAPESPNKFQRPKNGG